MKKEHTSSQILLSAWKAFKEEFEIPDKRSRKLNHVAARAAFCYEIRNINSFSLSEIGAVMVFKDNVKGRIQTGNLDHSTVLHLIRKASWGTYDSITSYTNARKYMMEYIDKHINDVQQDSLEERISRMKEHTVLKRMKQNLEKVREENLALKQANIVLIERIKKARTYRLDTVVREINLLNGIYSSLGYSTIKTEKIEAVNDLLKTINVS